MNFHFKVADVGIGDIKLRRIAVVTGSRPRQDVNGVATGRQIINPKRSRTSRDAITAHKSTWATSDNNGHPKADAGHRLISLCLNDGSAGRKAGQRPGDGDIHISYLFALVYLDEFRFGWVGHIGVEGLWIETPAPGAGEG